MFVVVVEYVCAADSLLSDDGDDDDGDIDGSAKKEKGCKSRTDCAVSRGRGFDGLVCLLTLQVRRGDLSYLCLHHGECRFCLDMVWTYERDTLCSEFLAPSGISK